MSTRLPYIFSDVHFAWLLPYKNETDRQILWNTHLHIYLVTSVFIGYSRTEMTSITKYIHKNTQRVTYIYVVAFILSRFLSYRNDIGHKITWANTFRDVHFTWLLPYKSETDHQILQKAPLRIYLVTSFYLVFYRIEMKSVTKLSEQIISIYI